MRQQKQPKYPSKGQERQIMAVVFLWKQLRELPNGLFHKSRRSENTKVLALLSHLHSFYDHPSLAYRKEDKTPFSSPQSHCSFYTRCKDLPNKGTILKSGVHVERESKDKDE